MFTKSLLALATAAVMAFSMSTASARDFDHRDGYRNHHQSARFSHKHGHRATRHHHKRWHPKHYGHR